MNVLLQQRDRFRRELPTRIPAARVTKNFKLLSFKLEVETKIAACCIINQNSERGRNLAENKRVEAELSSNSI